MRKNYDVTIDQRFCVGEGDCLKLHYDIASNCGYDNFFADFGVVHFFF